MGISPNCQVPSELDWGDCNSDFDRKYAHKMFFGKDIEQASSRFEENVIDATDELRFMPPVPFRYYMLAFVTYVMSEHVLKNVMASEAASCFLNLVCEKLQDEPAQIGPIMGDVMPAVVYVVENQEKFDADVDVYGDFSDRLAEIKKVYKIGGATRPGSRQGRGQI